MGTRNLGPPLVFIRRGVVHDCLRHYTSVFALSPSFSLYQIQITQYVIIVYLGPIFVVPLFQGQIINASYTVTTWKRCTQTAKTKNQYLIFSVKYRCTCQSLYSKFPSYVSLSVPSDQYQCLSNCAPSVSTTTDKRAFIDNLPHSFISVYTVVARPIQIMQT